MYTIPKIKTFLNNRLCNVFGFCSNIFEKNIGHPIRPVVTLRIELEMINISFDCKILNLYTILFYNA